MAPTKRSKPLKKQSGTVDSGPSSRFGSFTKVSEVSPQDINRMMLIAHTHPNAAMLRLFVVTFAACLALSERLDNPKEIESTINRGLKATKSAGNLSFEFAQALAVYYRANKLEEVLHRSVDATENYVAEIYVWAKMLRESSQRYFFSRKEAEALSNILLGAVVPDNTDSKYLDACLDAIEIIEGKEPKWQKQAQRESAGGCALPVTLLIILMIAFGSVL